MLSPRDVHSVIHERDLKTRVEFSLGWSTWYSQGEIKLINWDPNDNGVISIYNPLNQSSIINSKPIFLMGKHQMITLWLFNSSPWKDPPFF